MKYSIWKWVLEPIDEQIIDMPEDAVIISVKLQHEKICIWAEVDTTLPTAPRTILMYGTGGPFEPVGRFIDTVVMINDNLVIHVYEKV